MPFMIKAYQLGTSQADRTTLAQSLTAIALRNAIIGTRADMATRIGGEFTNFSGDVKPVVARIQWMTTTTDWWWAYWNNDNLRSALQGGVDRRMAKLILLIYENSLRTQRRQGYKEMLRFGDTAFDLEHIAPQTENPQQGYQEYTQDFVERYMDCLGNYLLLSSSQNRAIQNIPFADKLATYGNGLEQQEEVKAMAADDPCWNQEKIERRRDKLIDFVAQWPY